MHNLILYKEEEEEEEESTYTFIHVVRKEGRK
jgi:hypothetical protein